MDTNSAPVAMKQKFKSHVIYLLIYHLMRFKDTFLLSARKAQETHNRRYFENSLVFSDQLNILVYYGGFDFRDLTEFQNLEFF